METYARNDTHHLKPLADKLTAELEGKGRLAWHQESCARLIRDCSEIKPPNLDLAWRMKGSHRLTRSGLAVLREIWHWRELEAIEANKPRISSCNTRRWWSWRPPRRRVARLNR